MKKSMIGRLITFAILLLQLLMKQAHAECQAIDLRDRTNSPLLSMPIENQSIHGTCYAYASATMTNFDLLSRHGSDTINLVSPLELAAIGGDEAGMGTGAADRAITRLQEFGSYCPREHLSQWLNQHIGRGSEATMISILQGDLTQERRSQFMQSVRRYRESIRNLERESEIPPSARSSSSIANARLRNYSRLASARRHLVSQILPDGCECDHETEIIQLTDHYRFLDRFGRYLMEHEAATERDIFQEIIDIACQGHRVSARDLRAPRAEMRMENTAFTGFLDQLLQSPEAIPPVLSFCSKVFTEPRHQGIQIDESGYRRFQDLDTCGSHQVVVVASRPHPVQGCQYLIRNSWGANPSKGNYARSFEREDGGVWMSREQIQNNSQALITLR